jgi:hypothetical protein
MQRTCEVCEEKFEAKRATAKYCSGRCRKRNQRAGGAKKAEERRKAAASGVGSVAAATLLELQEASRLHTPLGQAALALAHRLDMSQMDTGAGVASLAKQLEATLSAATADAEVAADPIDELKAARERKRNAASG